MSDILKSAALKYLLGDSYNDKNSLEKSNKDNLSPELRKLLYPDDLLKKSEEPKEIKNIDSPKQSSRVIRNGAKIYASKSDKKLTLTRDFPVNILMKASGMYIFDYNGENYYVSSKDVIVPDDSNILSIKVKPKLEKAKTKPEKEQKPSLGFAYEQKIKDGLGLTRDKLPQVDEDSLDDFLIHYSDKAKVKKMKMKIKDLKFSQGEIDEEKVLDMMKDDDEGWKTRKYIMSLDKYLLDGHHSVAAGLELDEETEVDVYRVNLPMKSLITRTNKMKIATNRDIDGNELKKALDLLEEAYSNNLISKEVFEKAKTSYEIGEISQQTGMKKVAAWKWVDPKTGKPSKKNEDEPKGKKGKKKEEDKQPTLSPEEISNHAKNSSESDLKATAAGEDPKLREAAHAELDRREKEEKPQKEEKESKKPETKTTKESKTEDSKSNKKEEKPKSKQEKAVEKMKTIHEMLKERIKTWHTKQIDFYKSGQLEPNSEDRKGLKEFLKKKGKGILAGVKDEIHEYKEASSGMKKFFTGKKDEITKHEKKALMTVGIHMGIMIGGMAMTGGLSHLVSAGAGAMSKGLAIHWLEHAGITRIGHALAFAKAEDSETISDKELDKYLKQMFESMIEHIQSGDISEEDLIKIGDNSMNDFSSLYDLDENEAK